jgi:Xaa-Pro aminopeptidase
VKPFLLMSAGSDDPDFLYATRFPIERAVYVRFGERDDVVAAPGMEVERGRQTSTARRVVPREEAGWVEMADADAAWARVAATLLQERGTASVRVSPRLQVGAYERLRAAGIELELDPELLVAERRRKSAEELSFIHSAQRAAEAACAEVIAHLAVAEVREGLLWLDGRPLTAERLKARAQAALTEIGYSCPDMIVAGPPGSAQPHHRGEGQLRAGGPVIVDVFPRGSTSHYHGDLTRTVVVGDAPEQVRRMHDACLRAHESALGLIKQGANGRDVHRAACAALVEAGFGTTTSGLEGRPDGPRMNHALGHGVGLEVHEAPPLRDLDSTLEAGDVVTVEPGLYLAGLGGVRVEDTVHVGKDGCENLSSLPRSLDPRAYL